MTDNREEQLDEILADYLERREAGEAVDPAELIAAHPDFAGDIREFFADQEQMRGVASPLAIPVMTRRPVLESIKYFGDYELLEEIARGGMGIVYKARQKSLNRIVAVKMILAGNLASESEVKRFQTEAESAANLKHPNIVAVHEVGRHNGQNYFSMDFIDGKNLSEITRDNPLPAKTASKYARQVAEAIEFAHQQGTLHRDLKPSNVLIDANDDVQITDFGLALRVEGDSELTRTGQILGTPSYMPPEQARNKRGLIGPGSDVYSLGAILYELLTGRPPFRAESAVETLRQVTETEPLSPHLLNPSVPRDLETMCLKCLQKEPHKRYLTARHLAEDLQRYENGEPILARPISRPARVWRWCRRKPAVAGLSAALAVVVIVGFAGVTSQWLRAARALDDFKSEQSRRTALEGSVADLEMRRNRLNDSIGRIQSDLSREQGRSAKLQEDVRGLNERRKDLNKHLEREQRRLSALYVRLAGTLLSSGKLADARKYLALCPPKHRSWHWRFVEKQCDPVVAILEGEVRRRWALTTPRLAGRTTGFLFEDSNSGDDEPLSSLIAKTLKSVQDALPDGTVSVLCRSHNPDSKRLAVAIHWRDGRRTGEFVKILVLSVDSGAVEWTLPWNRKSRPHALGFNSNGRWLACFDGSRTVIWDVSTEWKGHRLGGFPGDVYRVRFSPDGRLLAAILGRNRGGPILSDTKPAAIQVWDVHSGQPRFTVNERTRGHLSIAFSPDGRRIGVVGKSGVRIWDLKSKTLSIQLPGNGIDLAFSPDGTRLVTVNSKKTTMWDLRTKSPVYNSDVGGTGVAFSPNGEHFAVATSFDKSVMIWNAKTRKPIREIETAESANRVTYSSDSSLIGVAEGRGGASRRGEKEMAQVFDANTGDEVTRVTTGGGEYIFDIAFSADGQLFATANAFAIHIWDVRSGQSLIRLNVPRPSVNRSRTAANGTRTVRRVQVANRAYTVAFSSNGKYFAAGWGNVFRPVAINRKENSGNVLIWDTGIGTDSLAACWSDRSSRIPVAALKPNRKPGITSGQTAKAKP